MTVLDLIRICGEEGLDIESTKLVIGFQGGDTLELGCADGSDAGDKYTIYLIPIGRYDVQS